MTDQGRPARRGRRARSPARRAPARRGQPGPADGGQDGISGPRPGAGGPARRGRPALDDGSGPPGSTRAACPRLSSPSASSTWPGPTRPADGSPLVAVPAHRLPARYGQPGPLTAAPRPTRRPDAHGGPLAEHQPDTGSPAGGPARPAGSPDAGGVLAAQLAERLLGPARPDAARPSAARGWSGPGAGAPARRGRPADGGPARGGPRSPSAGPGCGRRARGPAHRAPARGGAGPAGAAAWCTAARCGRPGPADGGQDGISGPWPTQRPACRRCWASCPVLAAAGKLPVPGPGG